MRGLKGKTAIVSGSSRGIGQSIALRLAQEGVAVFITAETYDAKLETTCAECERLTRVEHAAFDLQQPGAAEAMVQAAVDAFGRIDILVNNAGIRGAGTFGEFSYAEFDSVVAVNLRAAFFASQAVVPHMKAQGGGRIIHIASQHAIVANAGRSLYGMSKAGLVYLASAMAYELSPFNILVNAVSPGPIASEAYLQRAAADPDFARRRLSYIPLGRVGEPQDVAGVVAFLASEDATFIQGHNLVVDGGYITH
jgi:NAD(P)-dependent dehydrogenase (short-subunit alcohol dehydrogenase family)